MPFGMGWGVKHGRAHRLVISVIAQTRVLHPCEETMCVLKKDNRKVRKSEGTPGKGHLTQEDLVEASSGPSRSEAGSFGELWK